MGLAAGQARLLTITGRKSDCEFESMRLSHQKIALARQLADLSNEYQNSLTQTKLVYDYYGTGDTTTQLSYGILMTPSTLNNYMPTTLTDSMGRVCLNSKLAAAAAAAGIPQEGLGTLPSETTRNRFVQALCDNDVITKSLSKTIQSLPYNQAAGFGGGVTTAIQTQDMTLSKLADYLINFGEAADFDSLSGGTTSEHVKGYFVELNNSNSRLINDDSTNNDKVAWRYGEGGQKGWASQWGGSPSSGAKQITIGDILKDYAIGKSYYLIVDGQDDHNNVTGCNGIVDNICNCNFWDQMFDTFENLFDIGDAYTQNALAYARESITQYITNPSVGLDKYTNFEVGTEGAGVTWNPEQYNGMNDLDPNMIAGFKRRRDAYDSEVLENLRQLYGGIGINLVINNDDDGSTDNDSCMSVGSINISAMLMAYLTYFADFMNGVSKTTSSGEEVYDVTKREDTSHLVNDETEFTIKIGSEVSSDDLGQATFYDALFNQICAKGWTENNNITDNEYLQHMLQTGMLYVSVLKDDGYYYQGNYSTDSYIKEISDETYIAQAEAKYNTEKAKLNAKEETLDLKMKNLDTEISALTTEYDTVKNTISKQIEKSFKRYNA